MFFLQEKWFTTLITGLHMITASRYRVRHFWDCRVRISQWFIRIRHDAEQWHRLVHTHRPTSPMRMHWIRRIWLDCRVKKDADGEERHKNIAQLMQRVNESEWKHLMSHSPNSENCCPLYRRIKNCRKSKYSNWPFVTLPILIMCLKLK